MVDNSIGLRSRPPRTLILALLIHSKNIFDVFGIIVLALPALSKFQPSICWDEIISSQQIFLFHNATHLFHNATSNILLIKMDKSSLIIQYFSRWHSVGTCGQLQISVEMKCACFETFFDSYEFFTFI